MDCAIVLLVLLSLHTGCLGDALADPKPDPEADPDYHHHHTPRPPTSYWTPGLSYTTPKIDPPCTGYLCKPKVTPPPPCTGYLCGVPTTPPPPPPDKCKFEVVPSLDTIPVTETIVLPPVTVMQKQPTVTSYMDMSAITDTLTVIETTTSPTTDTTSITTPVTRYNQPISVTVSTIIFTLTETDEPFTETETRDVTTNVPGMPIETTVVLTSTLTQSSRLTKTITLDDLTTTLTYPPVVIPVPTTLVSTVILPPQTTTATSKWVMTHTPPPTISTHPPVTHNPDAVTDYTTLIITSKIVIPGEKKHVYVPTTTTICGEPTYSYPEPSVAFAHGHHH